MKNKFYIDSFAYEVELTARICHENAKRVLEAFTDEISIDEFTILDTIIAKPGLSQADLARLVLKGKAHTGRFIMSLEDKGLVERHITERDGKLIKVTSVTDKGMKLYEEVFQNVEPIIKKFEDIIPEDDSQKILVKLRKFRQQIEKASKIVFE